MSLFAQSVPFDQYGNVLLTDYENYAGNQTVTVVLTISNAGEANASVAPGWGVGTIKPINNEDAAAAYGFDCKAISAEGAENAYEFTIAQFKDFAKINGEYFVDQYDQKGITINVYNGATLTSITVGAVVEPSAVLDFENDETGAVYQGIGWSVDTYSAVVAANPSGTGKSLHFTSTNWNSYPKFTVTLPENKTFGDVEKIKLDIYFGEGGSSDQNNYKHFDVFVGVSGASFTANEATFATDNLVTNDERGKWLFKEIAIPATVSSELKALNAFDLGVGLLVENADYYLDNIQFILKAGSAISNINQHQNTVLSVEGGISVNANAQVTVFGIDGRVVKQTVAGNGQVIPLQKGVYIVKAGNAKLTKVLVK
ncbi:hypothetical protein FACS189463_0640 [Bacteroidia bacterium]|nr:hypothetical protein FACS189463_0640 [Bacteroidia bacterium]